MTSTREISLAEAQSLVGDNFTCAEHRPWGWIFEWNVRLGPAPGGPGSVFVLRDGRLERCGSFFPATEFLREQIERTWALHQDISRISLVTQFSPKAPSFFQRVLLGRRNW
jgi:hypothetical protein